MQPSHLRVWHSFRLKLGTPIDRNGHMTLNHKAYYCFLYNSTAQLISKNAWIVIVSHITIITISLKEPKAARQGKC